MTTYSGRLIREQGASVLTVASGGSINFPTGGTLNASGTMNFSGGITFGQASQTQVAGGLLHLVTGASLNVNLTASDRGTFSITDGTRSPTIGVGRNIPTHTASAGSIYLRSDGSKVNHPRLRYGHLDLLGDIEIPIQKEANLLFL